VARVPQWNLEVARVLQMKSSEAAIIPQQKFIVGKMNFCCGIEGKMNFVAELWQLHDFSSAELWPLQELLRNSGNFTLFPFCGTMATYCGTMATYCGTMATYCRTMTATRLLTWSEKADTKVEHSLISRNWATSSLDHEDGSRLESLPPLGTAA
jgi:hypothetical protein